MHLAAVQYLERPSRVIWRDSGKTAIRRAAPATFRNYPGPPREATPASRPFSISFRSSRPKSTYSHSQIRAVITSSSPTSRRAWRRSYGATQPRFRTTGYHNISYQTSAFSGAIGQRFASRIQTRFRPNMLWRSPWYIAFSPPPVIVVSHIVAVAHCAIAIASMRLRLS